MSTRGKNPGNAILIKIKNRKPIKAAPIMEPRCLILAPPTNIMVKQTINRIAAVEKSAGRIRPQISITGQRIGTRPFLKSLISACLLVNTLET